MMKIQALLRALLCLLSLLGAGCTTDRQTDPAATATEELLVTNAVDRSVEGISVTFPPDSKVFVDTQYYDTDGAVRPKYAIAAVRDQLLRRGAHLVNERKDADAVVELRSGAQSIDHTSFLIGVPSFPIPIPLAGTLEFPEIALFKIDKQTGKSSLALTAYDQKAGTLVSSTGTQYGEAHLRKYVILLVSWTNSDIAPGGP
jgi:hypothetical protein